MTISNLENEVEAQVGIQYYWCVGCGNHGNFERPRQRGLNCQECQSDLLTPFTLEEINEEQEALKDKFSKVLI